MSGVRRPRTPRAPRRTQPRGIYAGTAAEGDDLGAAAEIIAKEARRLASAWSKSIPDSIEVEVKGNTATVSTAAGPAYPAETRARHPVFGMTGRADDIRLRRGMNIRVSKLDGVWSGPPGEKFLGPAVDAKASEAVDRYARRIDRLIDRIGTR